jgi:hypothetical protein
MNPVAWSNLRPLDGSQPSAFEELCCQLAAAERMPAGSTFVRKAAPDAGVECYWKLPGGAEHAWQAKFFTDPLGDSQWQQLDGSLGTALKKHPNLAHYTVCIPRDREDPRIPNQEWFMDKWDQHVMKWEGWMRDAGQTVTISYWGTSEILDRLSREEHRGRCLFWFNEYLFTPSWFRERLNVTIANAGPRYSHELRVDLPIAEVFGGFCRTKAYVSDIAKARGRFGRETEAVARVNYEIVRERTQALSPLRERVLAILSDSDGNPPPAIAFSDARAAAAEMRADAWDLAHQLREVKHDPESPRPDPEADRNILDRAARAADALVDFASTDAAAAANARLLIIDGDAGKGKTHLLCDVVDGRLKEGWPSIVLLGQAFNAGEPWKQAISLLGLDCTPDEFLGALDASAEVVGGCALLAIDALNESAHRPMWLTHLAGMVEELKRHPRVRLAVSVRSSYEDAVIPSHLTGEHVARIRHEGFEGHEYVATMTFFRYYNIAVPSVPLLNPEFENPLFLKLFCEGLHSAGMTDVPKGLHGVSTVFGFFIDATNTKLAREDELGIDAKEHLVQRAVDRIADLMAANDVRGLPRAEAKQAIDAIHTAPQFDQTLFRRLVAEGVLAEDRAWSEDGPVEVVRFGYERLADHLITKRLLDRHVDADNPMAAFSPEAAFGTYLRSGVARWSPGLFAALAVQLPERFQLELPQVLQDLAVTDVVFGSVLESIVWRLPTAFTDASHDYIEDEIMPRRRTREAFLNAMLTVAATPTHPYNAAELHALLLDFTMPDRDAWWSTYLFRHAGSHGAVDRLVDWARGVKDALHIEDGAARLVATALAWFFTTSHRPLRDGATKGLIALLTPRLHVLQKILEDFRDVDDFYVRERLYAVAYGCAMRTTNHEDAAQLAQQVYDEVFRGTPPAHLLLRDYARGVVELALTRGATLTVDPTRIRPPYGAPWPTMPAAEEVEAYGERNEGMEDDEWARLIIHSSIMDGDFGRYVMGTNSGIFEWSPDPLNGPRLPRPREQVEAFRETLTPRQRVAYERVDEAIRLDVFETLTEGTPGRGAARPTHRVKAERAFRRTLGKKKATEYDAEIRHHVRALDEDPQFDLAMAQRWVLKRVFDLGWTVERFGHFDRREAGRGEDRRQAGKVERIGKKYQWIAWYEFLGLVADNFRYGDRFDEVEEDYEGPWQLFRRDIDPSVLLRKSCLERWRAHTRTWWSPVEFTNWNDPSGDDAWREATADLPAVAPLIDVIRPDGTRALVLETYCQWAQPRPVGADDYEIDGRRLEYWMKSYLVQKAYFDEVVRWARTRNLHRQRLPEVQHPTEVFLGEFPWARAVTSQTGAYNRRPGWTKGEARSPIPHPILATNDTYFWEQSGYDCSIDDNFDIDLPCKDLMKGLSIESRGCEGRFYDASGALIAFDPSVQEAGPGALVVACEPFLAFLEREDLMIFWAVFGERQVFSPHPRGMNYNELSGVYILHNGAIEGDLATHVPRA